MILSLPIICKVLTFLLYFPDARITVECAVQTSEQENQVDDWMVESINVVVNGISPMVEPVRTLKNLCEKIVNEIRKGGTFILDLI